MKTWKLTKCDIYFQRKYGIWFIYLVFLLFYLFLLSFFEGEDRIMAGALLAFTDPAAMGLFFMGAIILLEKSQRINCSLAVLPISISQYVCAKGFSLAITGTVVGFVIVLISGSNRPIQVLITLLLSSFFFSMCGLVIANLSDSLNEFVIYSVPIEIIVNIPAFLFAFGILKSPLWMIHPGVLAIQLLQGRNTNVPIWELGVLFLWAYLAFCIATYFTKQSFKKMEGAKL